MMKIRQLWIALLVLTPAWSQHKVDLGSSHERIIAIVPMIGAGTWADPKRPMFAPTASQIGRDKSGILGYYHEPTDDGKSAIVVLVAQDRSAFKTLLASAKTSAAIQVFDPVMFSSHVPASAVQAAQNALTAVKKDFDWKRFAVRVP